MTPADLARLTEEERAIFERSKDDRDKIVGSEVRWILSRLAQARAERDFHEREERERNQQALGLQEKLTQARAVVEAARLVQAVHEACGDCPECEEVPCEPHAEQWTEAMQATNAALLAHDAEAGR